MQQDIPTARRVVSTTSKVIGLVALSFVLALAVSLIPAGDEPPTQAAGESSFLIRTAVALPPSGAAVAYFHDAFPDRGRAPEAEAAPSF
jgi:hypothetical protein